jgi:uncharacterized DUF497 family protein
VLGLRPARDGRKETRASCEVPFMSAAPLDSREFGDYRERVPTVIRGDFEWDDHKAERNLADHGVAFQDAALAMTDPMSIDFDDLARPENVVTLAASPSGAILYIVSTDRDERIRIISARRATTHERRIYEEGE